MDQFGPPDDHFRDQNAIFETIWSLKTACFAHEIALWGHLGGAQGSKNGPAIVSCKHWSFEPLCGVWKQIWCPTRLPEVKKEIFGGPADTS